jgi:hypothetical protein
MEAISPFVLRAMACDIEEMQSPQAWADRCRAAAAEIERLRAALKQARRDAREEAALVIANKTVPETPVSFEDVLERDLEMMAAIRALGEKK